MLRRAFPRYHLVHLPSQDLPLRADCPRWVEISDAYRHPAPPCGSEAIDHTIDGRMLLLQKLPGLSSHYPYYSYYGLKKIGPLQLSLNRLRADQTCSRHIQRPLSRLRRHRKTWLKSPIRIRLSLAIETLRVSFRLTAGLACLALCLRFHVARYFLFERMRRTNKATVRDYIQPPHRCSWQDTVVGGVELIA